MQGFGATLASSARALALRDKILKDDSLIAWPSSRLVGVCKNKDAQRLNAHLLRMVADFWCPQWKSPAMIPIDDIKAEVLELNGLGFWFACLVSMVYCRLKGPTIMNTLLVAPEKPIR